MSFLYYPVTVLMRKTKLSIGNRTGKHFLLAVDYSSKLNEFHEASEGRKQGVPLRGAGGGGRPASLSPLPVLTQKIPKCRNQTTFTEV